MDNSVLKDAPSAKSIQKLVETPFWIDGLESGVGYETHDDDTPNDKVAILRVMFSGDGDVWVAKLTDPSYASIRKRTHIGGGKDLRTRQALMILAYAMKLDDDERKAREAKYNILQDSNE